MNKPGDIVMIFGNPAKLEHPVGQAKLIEKKSDSKSLENWIVEYLDDPEHTYTCLIKKQE